MIHWYVKTQKWVLLYYCLFRYVSWKSEDKRFTCLIHWMSWVHVCVEKSVSFKINASFSNTVLFMVIFLFKTPATCMKRYIKKFRPIFAVYLVSVTKDSFTVLCMIWYVYRKYLIIIWTNWTISTNQVHHVNQINLYLR